MCNKEAISGGPFITSDTRREFIVYPLPCLYVPPPARPHVVHAGQGLNVGLHTPTILGGNSHLSWFYDRGAIKDPPHTGTSEGLSQAINSEPIRKFLPNYANVYVTIQSHGFSAGVRTHYVTANGVWNGLRPAARQPILGE